MENKSSRISLNLELVHRYYTRKFVFCYRGFLLAEACSVSYSLQIFRVLKDTCGRLQRTAVQHIVNKIHYMQMTLLRVRNACRESFELFSPLAQLLNKYKIYLQTQSVRCAIFNHEPYQTLPLCYAPPRL